MMEAELPALLGSACGTSLRAALADAAREDEVLGRILADPALRTVVFALDVVGEPVARVVRVIQTPDTLAQWAGLACI